MTKISTNTKLIDDAIEYASLGLRVIPLLDRSKKPRMKDWLRRGTTQDKIIIEWFSKWPESNIGILTGNDLVALDLDPDKGGVESFSRLVGRGKSSRLRNVPFTSIAHTGSGGYHYLFRVDPGLRIGNRVGLRPGIDIRGDSGQIVVGPSVHPVTGGRYDWIYHPRQGIADAPKWLIELLTEESRQTEASSEPASYQIRPGLSFEKQGNAAELTQEIITFPGQRRRAKKRHDGQGDRKTAGKGIQTWTRSRCRLGVVGVLLLEGTRRNFTNRGSEGDQVLH